MLPLVHKQAIPSRCGVGYAAPFEQAKRILPDPRSDHEAAVHADRQLLNFSGLLFRNDRHVIDLQTLEHLRSMVARFWIEESTLQLKATTQFMKLLSNERSPAIEEVIQSGVVPRFVEFLMRKDFPQLQLEHLQSMVARVWSEESALQLEATSQFMKLLSNERRPPIEEVIQSGVPCFVEFLMRKYFPQLQFVAAWALTNFSYGTSENTNVVIDNGAVPIFAKLLSSPSDDVHEQAVWALGNVAGDSPEFCDIVLGNGVLNPLFLQSNEHAKLSMLRNSSWALPNFFRGKPHRPFDEVGEFPKMARRFYTTEGLYVTYESFEQGLLARKFIWFIRDIIRSCLDKYRSGILTASFDSVEHDGFSHYLKDGTDPIFPEGGIGTSGGLYVLLKSVLDFNDQHPRLAILFFHQLTKVYSDAGLHRLLDDLYLKGPVSRVRSMGHLYQAVNNFAPCGTFYYNIHDPGCNTWETAISRVGPYTSIIVTVDSLIRNIPLKRIRDAILDFRQRSPGKYGRTDISSCIACMRHGSEHCNQLEGPKKRVPKPLTMKETIWGLNEAFHIVYPFAQSFLNENLHHEALDPTYLSGMWEEI